MAVGKSGSDRVGKYRRVGASKPRADKATWEDADPDAVWKTIIAATNAGDALMFAKTRDGGACVLTVMSGDERVKEYATGEEELAALLGEVRASAEDNL